MRATLKALYSPDVRDLEGWQPEEPTHFAFLLQAEIGFVGSASAYVFDILVSSPSWFAATMLDTEIRSGEHTLFMASYDFRTLRASLERSVHACKAESWEGLARQLSRRGRWEYEGYAPTPAG